MPKIEKRPNSQESSIVALIVPGGQAELAGLQRGDILCWKGQDKEISYNEFIHMAASETRPILLDVRRIHTKAPESTATNHSAEVYQRKKAVIAAAEAREKAAKQWIKPIPKKSKDPAMSNHTNINHFHDEPVSEEVKKAIRAAKTGETELAKQLGYNPYETNKSTAGQARNATVAITHGTIQADNNTTIPHIATVAPPPPNMIPTEESHPLPSLFDDAYTAVVTSNPPEIVVISFSVMRKLIGNATTKGQTLDNASSSKFRRVRLMNEKIKAAIPEVNGALDLMMSVGFQLTEEDGESYLVYPAGEPTPRWVDTAMAQMEQYETNSNAI